MGITWSPGWTEVTPSPTPSTMPEPSCPRMMVTAQVVKTRITLQLATAERLRAAETEPLHPVGRLHMRR
jgi:hypothetical protein